MKIDTKHDVGDKVRFKNPDYVKTIMKTGKVVRIEAEVTDNGVELCYVILSKGRHGRMDEWFVPGNAIKGKIDAEAKKKKR